MFDVFDSPVLTEMISRPVEQQMEQEPFLGDQIAPFVQENDTEITLGRSMIYAFGKGQFKAPDAVPPLMQVRAARQVETVEILQLDEMHRIVQSEYQELKSPDQNIRRRAGVQLIDRGKILEIRNRRLAEDMRWKAMSGELVVVYSDPNADTIVVDYRVPAANKPTAVPDWTNTTTAQPVVNMRAWQLLVANGAGQLGTQVHMNENTLEFVLNNTNVRSAIDADNPQKVPTVEQVEQLLRPGSKIVVYNGGYLPEGADVDGSGEPLYSVGQNKLRHYLPNGRVLVTTPYTVNGQRIMDTANGLVDMSSQEQERIVAGPQSEVILEAFTKARYLRQARSALPRIYTPEAFCWATVYPGDGN